jgi:hypothetical protein
MYATPFPLSMLDRETQRGPTHRVPCPVDNPLLAHYKKEIVSAVDDTNLAAIFSTELGREIPVNRVSIKPTTDDMVLVGQYIGPMLLEGAKALPEGATIEWWVI